MLHTKFECLPLEVYYMILDQLSLEEKCAFRLVNKRLMKVGSCIFRIIRFKDKSDVEFFTHLIKEKPHVGAHVQTMLVRSAAILRLVNASFIKRYCFNTSTIDIYEDQGRGTWGHYLQQFKHLQHPPIFEDDKNAEQVLSVFRHQLSTLRLGGPLLRSFTVPQLLTLLSMVPNIKKLTLNYPFDGRRYDPFREFKGSLRFEDVNQILKQVNQLDTLEIDNGELSNVSMIEQTFGLWVDKRQQLNAENTFDKMFTYCAYLSHLKLDNVMIHHVSLCVRSILENFINLESLEIRLIKHTIYANTVLGRDFYHLHLSVWDTPLNHKPRLKKLVLTLTQAGLAIPNVLTALGKSNTPLEELVLEAALGHHEDISSLLLNYFSRTLKKLRVESHTSLLASDLESFPHLESFSFHFSHRNVGWPFDIFTAAPKLKYLAMGYVDGAGSVYLDDLDSSFAHQNLTHLRLDNMYVTEYAARRLLLPLVNLKEVIFEHCVFEYRTFNSLMDLCDDLPEAFDAIPMTKGIIEKTARNTLFDRSEYMYDSEAEENPLGYVRYDPSRRKKNRTRYMFEARKDNIHLRSLSLQHLGIHDCKLREQNQSAHTAKAIRNFQVAMDERSGCHETYTMDRAVHEKKYCNPHVVLNSTVQHHGLVTYHFTHEYGGVTGKNNYQQTRPTFRIRLFSLDKLSIRSNSLMSIYFKNKEQSRLTTCKQCMSKLISETNSLQCHRLLPTVEQVRQRHHHAKVSSLGPEMDHGEDYSRLLMHVDTDVDFEVNEDALRAFRYIAYA